MIVCARLLGIGVVSFSLAGVIYCVVCLQKIKDGASLHRDRDTVVLEKKLDRHGNLDRIVKREAEFARKLNKSNIAFYRDNIEHLQKLDNDFKRLIFRHRNLVRCMTYEWGAVKEQLVLMMDGNVNKPDMQTLFKNREKLQTIISRIDELTNEQQSILLMWENVKAEREKQMSRFDEIEADLLKTSKIDLFDNFPDDKNKDTFKKL